MEDYRIFTDFVDLGTDYTDFSLGKDTPDRQTRRTEIEDEANRHSACAKIIDHLFDVWLADSLSDLQFDDHLVFDHDIGVVGPDTASLVGNTEGDFLADVEVATAEFMDKGVLVDRFDEPLTERVEDLKAGFNDALGQSFSLLA